MEYLISIIFLVAGAWLIVGFLDKRKAKKAAEQTAREMEQIRESRLQSNLCNANKKLDLLPGNPFLANNMTQRALFMRKHSANPDLIKDAMEEAKIKYPFDIRKIELLKKCSSGNTISKKWNRAPNYINSSAPDTLINTVLAIAVLNDAFISSDTTKSETATFSGNGGSFGGGVSSGSWDSSSSDSGYDSGGGFDSGSSGSFGSD